MLEVLHLLKSASPLLKPTWHLDDPPRWATGPRRRAPEHRIRSSHPQREPPPPSRQGKKAHVPQPSAGRNASEALPSRLQAPPRPARPRLSLRAAPPPATESAARESRAGAGTWRRGRRGPEDGLPPRAARAAPVPFLGRPGAPSRGRGRPKARTHRDREGDCRPEGRSQSAGGI